MVDEDGSNMDLKEGQFEGEEDLERLVLIFTQEDGEAIAIVEGSKIPLPEVGEKITFGTGELIINLPEKDLRESTTTTGNRYRIDEREISFVNQSLEYKDLKIGPLTRGRSGQGLTTLVFYTVSQVSPCDR